MRTGNKSLKTTMIAAMAIVAASCSTTSNLPEDEVL